MFTNYQETMFFNPDSPQEICPNIWLGPYSSLTGPFLVNNPMQIIINCGSTLKFLDLVENDKNVAISSDVILLSLDPAFDSNNELVDKFKRQFTKILHHYLNFFYLENPKSSKLMYKLPQNSIELTSPIISGSNLKFQFFNLIRLMTLFKVINSSLQILVVSEDGNNSLSTGLIIAYLMDCYRYNISNSFRLIQNRRPTVRELNNNFYDDLLIIEHLKKFYIENCEIKNCHAPIVTTNYMLKRRNDDTEEEEVVVGGADRKRRFVH